jgi:hypothetical protein
VREYARTSARAPGRTSTFQNSKTASRRRANLLLLGAMVAPELEDPP